MKELRLKDLTGNKTSLRFIAENWVRQQPHFALPSSRLLSKLNRVEGLNEPITILNRGRDRVKVFGPDRSRLFVTPAEAVHYLRDGYTVYIHELQKLVPGISTLLAGVASELGIPISGVSAEMFVGNRGSKSTLHFDHDANFQILLRGRKTWRIAENRNIVNPLSSYHPPADGADGNMRTFREEAYARDAEMPSALPVAHRRRFVANGGAVVFLPRGWWHETFAVADCLAVNIAIRGTTWAHAMSRALACRLQALDDARGYSSALVHGRQRLLRDAAATRFESLRREAVKMLSSLTLEDVQLAGQDWQMQWTIGFEQRAIVAREEKYFLVVRKDGGDDEEIELETEVLQAIQALMKLRGPFRWEHVLRIGDGYAASDLWRLLMDLRAANLLRTASP